MTTDTAALPGLTLGWVGTGTHLLTAAVAGLLDRQLDDPTALPGWSRRHLLAHVTSNAEALGRLTQWARTGTETPMYLSVEERDRQIAARAAGDVGQLRRGLLDSAGSLATAWSTMPVAAWRAEVVTIQGRVLPAEQLPWLRAREVGVHTVDLGCGLTFADLPVDFCRALVDDVVAWRTGRADGPSLQISTPDGRGSWLVPGRGDPAEVVLPVPELAAWLTGRSTPPHVPELPRWL